MKTLLLLALLTSPATAPPVPDGCNSHLLRGVTSLTAAQDYWLITSRGAVDLASRSTVWMRTRPSLQIAIADCSPGSGWGHIPDGGDGVQVDAPEQPVILENEWPSGKMTVRVRTNCLGLGQRACVNKHKRAVDLMALTFPPN